jgi:hypothetical protein
VTKEQFQLKKLEHDNNLVEAYELLKKDPEGYSDDGIRLRELIDEIDSWETWLKNFRAELVRWKHRAE